MHIYHHHRRHHGHGQSHQLVNGFVAIIFVLAAIVIKVWNSL